jgi:hypothetical protein
VTVVPRWLARLRSGSALLRIGALAVLLSACAREPTSLADASQAASSHLATFARFERWATRVERTDVQLRGEQALREATFAPLRADRSVLWAEVEANTGPALQFASPIDVQPLAFVQVDIPQLGRLKVATSDACRPAAPLHAPSTPCVVIARESAGASSTSVRMAFRQDAAGVP